MNGGRWLLVITMLVGCGASALPERAEPQAEQRADREPPEVRAASGTAGDEPAEEGAIETVPMIGLPPDERVALPVPPPAGLAAAIAARLPTIELVPESCGTAHVELLATSDRVCLFDTATGRTRAMRRFATSDNGAVHAARRGNDVIFAVFDQDAAATRYAGRIWRWFLEDDHYEALTGLGADTWGTPRVQAVDFGILVLDTEGEVDRLFADGELVRVRTLEVRDGLIHVVDGHTYSRRRSRHREVLELVTRDGPRISFTSVATYPRAYDHPLAVHFPEGRSLIVSAFPHGETTTLSIVEPPAAEVRELSVAVRRPRAASFVDGAFHLRNADGTVRVDLVSGAVTPVEATEVEEAAPVLPRSIYDVIFTADGSVALTRYSGGWMLGAAGATAFEGDAPASLGGCRCDDVTLACGDTRIEAGCSEVAELERMTDRDFGTVGRSTVYGPSGRLRADRLEPDLVRLTRLSDGVRIWVRILDQGIFAQADDGAFVPPEGTAGEGWSLRWGRSLLTAPVTALSPHREAFSRPTLLEDFFGGRPLPSADTTLPPTDAD